MTGLATIIIPSAPHHAHLLPRAIQSAYAQTLPVQVRHVIDTEKKGPGWGRNFLARQADTPFIITLDADDILLPDFTETLLKAWRVGTYVYSGWFYGDFDRPTMPIYCYGMRHTDGKPRATYHLPATLIPTAIYHALGGYDETLFGAEDTEFFWRANASGIRSVRVETPHFIYTPDGRRAKEASADSRWMQLLHMIFDRHKRSLNMGCCDGTKKPASIENEKQDGDILASPLWSARVQTFGRKTGRYYGKISASSIVWISPSDFNEREWRKRIDAPAISPTQAQIMQAVTVDPNDPVAVLEDKIKRAGVRVSFNPVIKSGFDIQQNPHELAQFLALCQKNGVKRVLEIGTGESAGLARFMTEILGWQVVSVDTNTPSTRPNSDKWEFIKGDSKTVDIPHRHFDMVFIDGDHTYEAVKADFERFKDYAPIIGIHDISHEGNYADTVAKFWDELSKTKTGKPRQGFSEFEVPYSGMGIGVYERN
jgi:hypothetical protein